ncbi:pyoverdine export/recycling transporter outer membrane subunit OmpQ [soil metagenome]
MMALTKMGWAVAALVLQAGCATPVLMDAVTAPNLPAQWRDGSAAAREQANNAAVTGEWWQGFGSPELDALVTRAGTLSLDLAAAATRVRQAAATARQAGAALRPSITATADANAVRSLNGTTRSGASATSSSYGGLIDASYEPDFSGRNRALRDSALAAVQASDFDRDGVRLTVTSATAAAWLQAVALRERSAIAGLNVRSAESLLALVESRARAGAATPLELAQQRGLVATQRRAIASLAAQVDESLTTVAQLLGQAGGVQIGVASLDSLTAPSPSAGVPSDLLLNRPDIARAEAELAAANADVAAARAAMLPRVTLGAGVGFASDRIASVFDNPIASLAAGLAAPIFDAGRLEAGRDLAIARREELVASYRSAIVGAFADVETALIAIDGAEAQSAAHAEELAQARNALRLAESRYRAGAETSLTLLDAQRTLYAAQDTAVQLKMSRLVASVSLYKALGGGWRTPAPMAGWRRNSAVAR